MNYEYFGIVCEVKNFESKLSENRKIVTLTRFGTWVHDCDIIEKKKFLSEMNTLKREEGK